MKTLSRCARYRWPLRLLGVVVALALLQALPAAEKSFKSAKAKKAAQGPERWEETMQRFEAADRANPPAKGAALLVGGSNARRWTDVGRYFPSHVVINRGFGGAKLSEVLHFADRMVLPYAPKTIVLNAGGNDLSGGRSPEAVRDDFRAFVKKVRAALPETRICLISVPPVMRLAESPENLAALRHFNGLMAEVARSENGVEYIDLVPHFLNAEGKPRAELYVSDGVHFTPQAYEIVARLLREKL